VTREPSVSVVLPVHNGMPHLEESISSILGQTLGDFELIVGDDGSDDLTGQTLVRLAAKDGRIRLLRQDRKSGPAAAANWVISHARAPLVAIAHADDIAHPDRLRRQVEVFQGRPDVVLVGAMCTGIDANGRGVHPPNLWRLGFPTTFAPMAHSSVMFRRSSFHQVGGYRSETDCWEDLDLYWRLYRLGRILVIPDVLTRYRYSGNSLRERARADGLERSLERMYRSADLYRRHGDYEPLVAAPTQPLGSERIDPRIFVARSWMRVWSGRRAIVFGQMLRRARFRLDSASVQTFAFVLWATVSPKSLRLVLQAVTGVRNAIIRRRIGRQPFVEWRPRQPEWQEWPGTDSSEPGSAAERA
jgi:glycosyltransferase involved in cell wall biosynthesis